MIDFAKHQYNTARMARMLGSLEKVVKSLTPRPPKITSWQAARKALIDYVGTYYREWDSIRPGLHGGYLTYNIYQGLEELARSLTSASERRSHNLGTMACILGCGPTHFFAWLENEDFRTFAYHLAPTIIFLLRDELKYLEAQLDLWKEERHGKTKDKARRRILRVFKFRRR